jgi:hypothetical protein
VLARWSVIAAYPRRFPDPVAVARSGVAPGSRSAGATRPLSEPPLRTQRFVASRPSTVPVTRVVGAARDTTS